MQFRFSFLITSKIKRLGEGKETQETGRRQGAGAKLPSALTERNLFPCSLCASEEIGFDSCCL